MKTSLALILSLCLFGISSISSAVPIIQIPAIDALDMQKNGTGGAGGNGNANNVESNLFRLETVLENYNSEKSVNLLALPDLVGATQVGATQLSSNVVGTGGLLGFDYAVLHYGKGSGGIGQGGGVAFYYLNGASEATFPAMGTRPNGLGGFSSLTLFKGKDPATSVPDGGSTVILLGTALGVIAAARRRFRV